ncbi:MAG: IS5 family transposase [Methanobacteriales archaeon Met13]
MPVAILIHSGAPHDTKIFTENNEKLQKRRIIQKQDTIIFDRGYYKYENYQIGISNYQIVPFLFPQRKFQNQKIK